MISKSYANLLDLITGDFPTMSLEKKRLPRVMSVPGNISELESEKAHSVSSDNPSITPQERMIIVANQLPIISSRGVDGKGWIFSHDEDSLLLQLRDGLPDETEVIYIGSLRANVDSSEQDSVSQILLDSFKCVPTFLPPDLSDRYYNGFCKTQLWPLFHYMLPFSSGRFDRSLWEDYVSVNRLFSQKVIEVLNPEDDFIWIHDYHLMALPTFLRRRFHRIRMGFFLHSPFPSSEIYRTLPVREDIIRALLNTDLIGFHTFDYARHFLSCCSRLLGLEYQSKRGYLGLEYHGRTIGIKIMPVGIHLDRIQCSIRNSNEAGLISQVRQKFDGKTVILGVDDLDLFKGLNLKLLAMEQMLKEHHKWRGKAVLVQIIHPARSTGSNTQEILSEIVKISQRINKEYGMPGYEPVVIVHKPVSALERVAYYTVAECVVVTAVRDGMNLIPYEYIASREGLTRNSMIVVSEFIGCSPSLSGALRINPWNIETTAEAMNFAISVGDSEKELRHKKHYRYISSHNVGYWARSFMQDLERTCSDHFRRRYWGVGLGFGFRVVSIDPNFSKLSVDAIGSAYRVSENRAILFDYDGTLMPHNCMSKKPNQEVISVLGALCSDSRNTVFIVSGRGKDSLSDWFSPCKKLGIAAEHGYFLRWPEKEEWENCGQCTEFGWMQLAEPVMESYTEATDGSYIESKESALVWHYQDADPDFGSAQAKEMLDHLESVLANEPVAVKKGHLIVEVKPQGVTKGMVCEKVFTTMAEIGKNADFVLSIGDDRSDEDMFEILDNVVSRDILSPTASIFSCTVGQKPSKAHYFVNDTVEVRLVLESLAEFSDLSRSSA